MIDVNKFIDAVKAEIGEVVECVISGIPIDYAEYKEKTGYIQGLNKALDILDGLMDE